MSFSALLGFQASRHGGARPGAGAPRGPRRSTIAWHGLVAILVRREVGDQAYAVMPRCKVLQLAARIFMCDGDHALAARAYRQAARLTRRRTSGPARSQARTPPVSSAPTPTPKPAEAATTQIKSPPLPPATPDQSGQGFRRRLFCSTDHDRPGLWNLPSRLLRAGNFKPQDGFESVTSKTCEEVVKPWGSAPNPAGGSAPGPATY